MTGCGQDLRQLSTAGSKSVQPGLRGTDQSQMTFVTEEPRDTVGDRGDIDTRVQ